MSTGHIEYRDRSDMTEDELAEADAEDGRSFCVQCGTRLGLDCGEAEPDYDDRHCSRGCFEAMQGQHA